MPTTGYPCRFPKLVFRHSSRNSSQFPKNSGAQRAPWPSQTRQKHEGRKGAFSRTRLTAATRSRQWNLSTKTHSPQQRGREKRRFLHINPIYRSNAAKKEEFSPRAAPSRTNTIHARRQTENSMVRAKAFRPKCTASAHTHTCSS